MKDIATLQNGSDIRGIALPGVPGEEVNLEPYKATAIAEAFVYWLSLKLTKSEYNLHIAIGHDSRLSAEPLKEALMKGICTMGSRCTDTGLSSTPAMFMSTVMPAYDFDGAIMITASHLPWNRNGFKFFTAEGGLDKEDIAAILKRASTINPVAEHYECDTEDLMDIYSSHLRSIISAKVKGNLEGMKIVVDAGNGAGGFFAEKVLAPLGADVSGSQFLEPDGHFPNHIPNPENAEAMDSICRRVREVGADLGIIFDTDVDRSAAVTGKGEPISRNAIVALAAALQAPQHPGGTIVTDSITSNELHDFLENTLGLKHLRFKRGYRNVINKAIDLAKEGEDAFLAIETSGHAAYADNYYLDDGAYLACLIVAAAAILKKEGKDIESLIDALQTPTEARELRFAIQGDDFVQTGTAVLDGMPEWVTATDGFSLEEPNYEGVRVNFDLPDAKGWFLLRKSLHDPVLPLNIESTNEGGISAVLPMIRSYLEQFEDVDLSVLDE